MLPSRTTVAAPAIRYVIFDVGNTLMHLDYAFIADILAEHDHPTTPLAIRIAEYEAKAALDRILAPVLGAEDGAETYMWPGGEDRPRPPSYFSIVLQHLGVAESDQAPILAALQRQHQASSLWRVVEPDTTVILDALRARGLILAVISNADGRIEADLERTGLRRHFTVVIDSHVVGVEKPNPAIFALALTRLGATAEAALYVGDMLTIDVLGARRAGLRAVLMDTLSRYPGAGDCPRISRLGELIDLLAATEPPPAR
jgi:putative hydrolase of the HAD superfamily